MIPFVNPVKLVETLDGDGSTRYFFFRGSIEHPLDPNHTQLVEYRFGVVEVHDADTIYLPGDAEPHSFDLFIGDWAGPIPTPETMKENR